MRSLILAIALLGVSVLPVAAQQLNTAPLPPTVVQDITPIDGGDTISPMMGGVIGAVSGVVALNAFTSGLVLTPLVGVTASNILGGAWLGSLALLPASAEALLHTTSTMAIAFASGTIGYVIVER
jgi:hypothetical protein